MSLYDMSPEGKAILICQVCKNRCHPDGPKTVYQDAGDGNYKMMECPMCCCHECVQLADDPIRRKLAPRIVGQTRANPFSIEHAMREIGGILGLRAPAPKQRIRQRAVYCSGCDAEARTKCITCEEPLCTVCVDTHRCPR